MKEIVTAQAWDHHTLPEGRALYTTALCTVWNIHSLYPGVWCDRYLKKAIHGERRSPWPRTP
jgi:hypothetical protein